ncbi:MAG: DUF1580 domain-containing protein [Rubripirellula sp.]|nr:DUF1580 domain-containing protein [Rubripirellula sp.]
MANTIILTEDLLTLRQATKEVPRAPGQGPLHYATIWRWTNRGLRGHKLETIKVGQQHMTSKQRLHVSWQQPTKAAINDRLQRDAARMHLRNVRGNPAATTVCDCAADGGSAQRAAAN